MTFLRSREPEAPARSTTLVTPAISLAVAIALVVTLATGNGWVFALVLALGVACTQAPIAASVFAVAALLVPNTWLQVGLFYEKAMVGVVLVGALGVMWLRDSNSLRRIVRIAWPRHRVLVAVLLAPLAFITAQVALAPVDWRHAIAERAADYSLALLLGAVILVEPSAVSRRRTAWCLVAVGVVEALLAGLQAGFRDDLVWGGTLSAVQRQEATNIHGYFRGIGTVGHGNSLALVLVLFTCLGAWLLITAGNRRERWFAVLSTLVLVLGVLSSLSRAGMLALGLMLLAAVAYGSRRIHWSKQRVATAAVLIVLVGLAVAVVPPLRHSAERYVPGREAARDAGSGDVRAALVDASMQAFEDRPLAGWGYGADVFVLSHYNPGLWRLGTHSSYLDLLVGGGLIGSAAFLAAALGCAWTLRRVRGSERSLVGLTLVAVLTYAFFETLLAGPALLLIAAIAGFSVWRVAKRRDTPGAAE